jgi:hypothetical protein
MKSRFRPIRGIPRVYGWDGSDDSRMKRPVRIALTLQTDLSRRDRQRLTDFEVAPVAQLTWLKLTR